MTKIIFFSYLGHLDLLLGRVLRDDEAEPDDEDDGQADGGRRQPPRHAHARVQAAHPVAPLQVVRVLVRAHAQTPHRRLVEVARAQALRHPMHEKGIFKSKDFINVLTIGTIDRSLILSWIGHGIFSV